MTSQQENQVLSTGTDTFTDESSSLPHPPPPPPRRAGERVYYQYYTVDGTVCQWMPPSTREDYKVRRTSNAALERLDPTSEKHRTCVLDWIDEARNTTSESQLKRLLSRRIKNPLLGYFLCPHGINRVHCTTICKPKRRPTTSFSSSSPPLSGTTNIGNAKKRSRRYSTNNNDTEKKDHHDDNNSEELLEEDPCISPETHSVVIEDDMLTE